jgi:hypothetical protein
MSKEMEQKIPAEFYDWARDEAAKIVGRNYDTTDVAVHMAEATYRHLMGYGLMGKVPLYPSGHSDPIINVIIRDSQKLEKERDEYRAAMEDVASRIQDVSEYRSFNGQAKTVLGNLANIMRHFLAKYSKP